MKILPIAVFLSSSMLLNAQMSLLDVNENESKRQALNEAKISSGFVSADKKEEEQKKPFPLLSFGSSMAIGPDAVGFRPIVLAGFQVSKKGLGVEASVNFTTVDDQNFDTEKTGQTLFIPEISSFSTSATVSYGFRNAIKLKSLDNNGARTGPNEATKTKFDPRVGVSLGFGFRGNSLFNLDSTSFKSVSSDISCLSLHLGAECIIVREHFSIYTTFNYLGVTNGRDAYHNYFPEGAMKDYWYFRPGMKFKAAEAIDGFKGVIVDFSLIMLTTNMRVIAGNQNTVIPILKVGYQKKIGWSDKKLNAKLAEKERLDIAIEAQKKILLLNENH